MKQSHEFKDEPLKHTILITKCTILSRWKGMAKRYWMEVGLQIRDQIAECKESLSHNYVVRKNLLSKRNQLQTYHFLLQNFLQMNNRKA